MGERQHKEEQIRKRVACEERAFHVVLRLLENPITEDYLRDAGQLISPSHYADVVEERSIAKLCGYPPCGNSLGRVPKQKYCISTKSNMVFDLTERKKFCSNYCLKASQYFEKQISTSPVWAREKEPKVNFEFLRSSEQRCSVGDAVFLPLPQIDLKKEVDRLEKLDKDMDSKKKDGGEEEELLSAVDAGTKHDSSDLLSDVVDRMAEVKVSYMGEADGINVDFSDEKTKEETLVSKNRKHKYSGEVTHEKKGEDVSKAESSVDHGPKSKIEPDTDCNGDDRTASNQMIKPKDVVVDNLCNTDCQPQSPLVQLKQTEGECSMNKCSSSRSSYAQDSATRGPLPGESKEDYVMRLLNRKKHLLGQLADIQQTEMSEQKNETSDTAKHGIPRKPILNCDTVDSDDEDVSQLSESEKKKDIVRSNGLPEEIKFDKPLIQEIISQEIGTKHQKTPPEQKQQLFKKRSMKVYPLNAVAKVMEDWVTRDSLRYLGVCKNDDLVTQPSDFEKNYAQLCQKVSAEEKDFEGLLGEETVGDSVSASTCPVPDFKKLEAETKEFELKVKEFYKGTTAGSSKKNQGKTDDSPVRIVQLPVVDSHDQMTIRRKIVLDRLNKVIPDLLTPLRLSIQDVSHLIRELIYTFSFTSENILFKPGEWSLVGILIMKMLSLKSKKIDTHFKEDSALKYFHIILSSIGHKTEDLDKIIHSMAYLNLDS